MLETLPSGETIVKCDKCGKVLELKEYPFCPHGFGANGVIDDDIPGGVEIKHGLCNEDGTPRRYYSKSEMAKEALKRGLTNYVTHVPSPGSDKNKKGHTTRWI